MNSKIQEILHNQTRKNMRDVDVRLVYINKLPVIQSKHPTIFVDDVTYFYTFDGRGLFLSKLQATPYISLPYETTSLYVTRHPNGTLVAVALNSKQKLECVALDDFDKGQKQVITRNVQQAIKSGDNIFYVFNKDGTYFIDEVRYHGGRWIGKHVCPPFKGEHVELFPANGSVIYTVDGKTYSLSDEVPEVEAEFAHLAGAWLVVARACSGSAASDMCLAETMGAELLETEEASGYEIVCYSLDGERKNSYFINTRYSCSARGIDDFVVVLNEDKFYVLQTAGEGIRLVDIKKQKYIIYDFALTQEGKLLMIHALSDNTVPYQECICAPLRIKLDAAVSGENADDEMNVAGSLAQDTEQTAQIDSSEPCSTSSLLADSKEDQNKEFAAAHPGDHNAIVGGLQSLNVGNTLPMGLDTGRPVQFEALDCGLDVLRSGAEAIANQPLPRNHLFDAVRESMGRGKVNVSPSSPGIGQRKNEHTTFEQLVGIPGEGESHVEDDSDRMADRFEKYANEIILGLNTEAPTRMEEKDIPTADYDSLVRGAEASGNGRKYLKTEQSPAFQPCPSPSKQRGRLSADGHIGDGKVGAALHQKDDVKAGIYNTVYSALESVIVKNESFIKDLIARAIVPGIEAAVNEMRIQVITEFRRMDFASNLDPLCSKASSFKKLVNSGKIGTALQELVKLKGPEFESLLGIIHPDTIEDVDSNVLVLFIAKLCSVLKKHLRDHHARLFHEALEDIDISELSVDSLQSLSISLRSMKESAVLDSPNYVSLNYLMDFIYRKLRRRVSNTSRS